MGKRSWGHFVVGCVFWLGDFDRNAITVTVTEIIRNIHTATQSRYFVPQCRPEFKTLYRSELYLQSARQGLW